MQKLDTHFRDNLQDQTTLSTVLLFSQVPVAWKSYVLDYFTCLYLEVVQ
jgi:hypothetical protein